MRWEKLGRIYVADGDAWWARSHAYTPTPHMLSDRIRIYVAFWDDSQVGRLGFVDVAVEDPTTVLAVSSDPILDVGEAGTFDDSGVTPMSIVESVRELRLYYTGWQRSARVPYFMFTGVATSYDGGLTFIRERSIPVLDRIEGEHACRTAAFVQRNDDKWRVWYVGGSQWTTVESKVVPTYNIRHAESDDGLNWSAGQVVLDLGNADEFGLGRPFVRRAKNEYWMWYSIRSRTLGYRLGYATSPDGLSWERRDHEVGIGVSESGWDSEMICFGAVLDTSYGTYLFYNGNNFGETGFGVAVLAAEV